MKVEVSDSGVLGGVFLVPGPAPWSEKNTISDTSNFTSHFTSNFTSKVQSPGHAPTGVNRHTVPLVPEPRVPECRESGARVPETRD